MTHHEKCPRCNGSGEKETMEYNADHDDFNYVSEKCIHCDGTGKVVHGAIYRP